MVIPCKTRHIGTRVHIKTAEDQQIQLRHTARQKEFHRTVHRLVFSDSLLARIFCHLSKPPGLYFPKSRESPADTLLQYSRTARILQGKPYGWFILAVSTAPARQNAWRKVRRLRIARLRCSPPDTGKPPAAAAAGGSDPGLRAWCRPVPERSPL